MGLKLGLAGVLGCLLVSVSGFTAQPAHASTVRQVPGDHPTIAAALAASGPGDSVVVAPGTYVENLTVPSGVTLTSSNGPSVTTIDGGRAGIVAVIESGATVHGFTLRNGGTPYGDVGGAMVMGTLDGNVLTDNGGCYRAGAVWVRGGTVSNNVFRGNRTWCSPVPLVNGDGTIVGNTFDEDSGVVFILRSSPTIERNVFRGSAYPISMLGGAQPTIANNLFVTAAGAVMDWLVPLGDAGPTIVNNTIVGLGGSGPLVTAKGYDASTTFSNNVVVSEANGSLMSCETGYDNEAPRIEANNFWRPDGGGLSGLCSSVVGTAGNLGVDPLFVSPARQDYHLRADSPLIDAGVNGIAMHPDIDGDPRPLDGDEDGTAIVDPGFDEAGDPLAVVPGDVALGSIALARTRTETLVVQNLGSSPLAIEAVAVSGAAASDYSVAGETCSMANLDVGASCSIPVAFTPTVIGPRNALIAVTGPGLVGRREIGLAGTGTDPLAVVPTALSFDDVTVGDAAKPASILVSNVGGAPLAISSVTVAGHASDVTIGAETCTGAPLLPDVTCSVHIEWRPRDSGERSASIVIEGAAPVGTRSVPIRGHAWAPASGVSWGTTRTAGPAYAWNGGSGLARTVQSGAQRLHLAYATDRIGGRWATDNGPKVGVYYIRSSSGSTWTTPYRLNPTTEHATMMALAAGSSRVYAVWINQTRYVRYSPSAPRVLYVRVNSSHGASTAWKSRIKLTSSTGRVDYPAVAAYGKDAHIAYTNANTGTVYIHSSRDGGVTWSRATLGSTSIATREGRVGFPTVSAYGSTVAVCWLSDVAGTVRCRISTNRGVSWAPPTAVGTQATGYFSVSVRGTRVAVAWPTATEIVVRQRLAGTWTAPRAVQTAYRYHPYGVNVLLQDPSRLRVSWAERQGPGEDFAYVFSAESADGGSTYFMSETVGDAGSSHWSNDWPSVIWPTASTRYVAWNGWTQGTSNYRLYFKRGIGTPVGPFVASTAWRPASDRPSIGLPAELDPRRPDLEISSDR